MSEADDDEFDNHSAMELWLHDLSVDSATRAVSYTHLTLPTICSV